MKIFQEKIEKMSYFKLRILFFSLIGLKAIILISFIYFVVFIEFLTENKVSLWSIFEHALAFLALLSFSFPLRKEFQKRRRN